MIRWLDTLLIHDFHHTAQRLSEEQQQCKEGASLGNQTSVIPVESKNEQCTDKEATAASDDRDVCVTATEPGDKLDIGDEAVPANDHQTRDMVADETSATIS